MYKLALIGYGRMGKTIHGLAQDYGFEVHCIISKASEWNETKLQECDVAIDFSIPSSALNNILGCIQLQLPIVSGTTGWLDDMPKVQFALDQNPKASFLYGSNFSLGVNLFFLLNSYAAELMSKQAYGLQVKEIHHTKKLDAPSGTAISLANDIIDQRSDKTSWVCNDHAEMDELKIEAIREPDVPGTHEIIYENEIDQIKLTHTAHSRNGFAIGALQAAYWLIGKHGYYSIRDYVASLLPNHSNDEIND